MTLIIFFRTLTIHDICVLDLEFVFLKLGEFQHKRLPLSLVVVMVRVRCMILHLGHFASRISHQRLFPIGAGGCNACNKAVIDTETGNITKCLHEDDDCDDGYYQRIRSKQEGGPMVGKVVSGQWTVVSGQWAVVSD